MSLQGSPQGKAGGSESDREIGRGQLLASWTEPGTTGQGMQMKAGKDREQDPPESLQRSDPPTP